MLLFKTGVLPAAGVRACSRCKKLTPNYMMQQIADSFAAKLDDEGKSISPFRARAPARHACVRVCLLRSCM